MLSLSILNNLRKRGNKTNFLVFTPFLKMFPIIFEEHYTYEKGNKNVHRNCLKLSLYLDVHRFFQITILVKQDKIYIKGKHKINKPKIYINVESIYEYGNEEHFLPKIETIKIIKNKESLITEIKKELKSNNWKDEDMINILEEIESKIFKKRKISKNQESQENAINKEINKLVEYLNTNS